MALFAGLHYWTPKMFGRMYNKGWANFSWGVQFIGFNMLYFTMLVMGYEGMPRRYYDHLEQFHDAHVLATVGSWVLISGILIMFINLFHGMLKGEAAPSNPWNGTTLEWTAVDGLPPLENFDEIPVVTGGPYDHNTKAEVA